MQNESQNKKVMPSNIHIDDSNNLKRQSFLQQGSNIKKIGPYILGKTIGKGTFGKAVVARHELCQQKVAIKLIDKKKINTTRQRQLLNREFKILRQVRHPHICQLLQIFEDNRYFYIVNQYAERGQLFDYIVENNKLTEFQASKILLQILSAVEYMHEIGIAHRDIKLQNILLDIKYNVKIIDFGLSTIYPSNALLTTACGSPTYAAPEMLSGIPYDPLKSDIWSVGVVLYGMCFGYLPFDSQDQNQTCKLIKQGEYQLPEHCSQQLKSLLKIILQINPSKRVSISEIQNHKFCKLSNISIGGGIVLGLSKIPFQQQIQTQILNFGLQTGNLKEDITNNRHNNFTALYYLLLQQKLIKNNQTIVNYYQKKHSYINRYKIIQNFKNIFQKRIQNKNTQVSQSKKNTNKKQEKTSRKRSATAQKKNQINKQRQKNQHIHIRQFKTSPKKHQKYIQNKNIIKKSIHNSKKLNKY